MTRIWYRYFPFEISRFPYKGSWCESLAAVAQFVIAAICLWLWALSSNYVFEYAFIAVLQWLGRLPIWVKLCGSHVFCICVSNVSYYVCHMGHICQTWHFLKVQGWSTVTRTIMLMAVSFAKRRYPGIFQAASEFHYQHPLILNSVQSWKVEKWKFPSWPNWI